MTYPGEHDYAWITLETTGAVPHDDECEVARRERGEGHWADWRSCRCKTRRDERSRRLPERPVQWSWLTGRAS